MLYPVRLLILQTRDREEREKEGVYKSEITQEALGFVETTLGNRM